jgi:microcystin-dependent protein
MYAGMWWLDTSVTPNGSLKMRNLSNTAWTFPSIYGDDRVGEIAYYARPTPPVGWLKANGALVSRNTYQALFLAIGTQFGVGDGVNTFGLPDLRGQFVRGWDEGRGLDPSRAFGSNQASALLDHSHTAATTVNAGGSHDHGGSAASAGSHAHTGATDAQGSHQHNASGYSFVVVVGGSGGQGTNGAGYSSVGATNVAGNHAHNLTINAAGAHTHTITTDVEPAHAHTASTTVNPGGGGTETRPTNVSLLPCIRYA